MKEQLFLQVINVFRTLSKFSARESGNSIIYPKSIIMRAIAVTFTLTLDENPTQKCIQS